MTTKMLTVRITAEQQQRWTAAANASGVMLSDWVRRTCDWGHDEQIGKPRAAGTRDPGQFSYPPAPNLPREIGDSVQKISEPAVGSQRHLPRSTPVRRKHINVREDVEEEKSPEKFRCTYLWPSRSKKCPRCHQVHSDV